MDNTLFELADELKCLREKKAALEDELKEVNAKIDDTDYKLTNVMADSETQNFTRQGTMFCLTSKIRASAEKGMKDDLYAALKANGYADLVYETVNANSLSSFVKEQIEENGDELPCWLDGLVSIYEKATVSVRKSTKQ